MRRGRLVWVAAVCNVVVLALGTLVVAREVGARPNIAFDGDGAAASGPAPPEGEPLLPAVGGEDLPLADPAARRVALPSHQLDYLPPVLRSGVLDGDPALDGGCAWIEIDGEPQAIRWPGYEAGFPPEDGSAPFELVDESGRVVARGGETVWFFGARSGGAERLERCHVGADHVWYVDAVGTDGPF